jgi:hypothetical protein
MKKSNHTRSMTAYNLLSNQISGSPDLPKESVRCRYSNQKSRNHKARCLETHGFSLKYNILQHLTKDKSSALVD